MSKLSNVYEPEEDSFLLLELVLSYIKKNKVKSICEVGVGSGFVISNIAKKYPKHNFYGTDINPDAITLTKEEFKNTKTNIDLKQTSILENINKKIDLIIFNTPYLPMEKYDKWEDLTLKDKAIYGGRRGYEVIDNFILQVNDSLKNNGEVIMIFSSFSNLKHIKETLKNNFFEYEMLEEKKTFFESMYALKFWKSDVLKKITSKKIVSLKYMTKGKHSKILSGKFRGEDVVVKVGEEKDIQIEEIFLKKFSKYDFVPKLYIAEKNFVVMEKLSGVQFRFYLDSKRSSKEISKVFDNIFDITRELDKIGVNKFELTNPVKHIFVNGDCSVKFIDFERTLYAPSPKNTTQVLQFVRRLKRQLGEHNVFVDEKKILEVSSKYKRKPYEFKFKDLLVG